MAYTPFQDGTEAFGIPDSPITINSIAYIAEDINLAAGQQVVEIKNTGGVAKGQVLIPQTMTGTAKLQLATATTVHPARNQNFTLQSQVWLVETVGASYTQGAYTYVNITFREKLT